MPSARTLFLLSICALFHTTVFAVEVPFAAEANINGAAFTNARSVQTADFDQDGDMDVVAGRQTAGVVTWFENTAGDGSAWTPHGIDDDFGNLTHIEVADINGDGYPDVLASRLSTNIGQDSVVWYMNDQTPADDTTWTLQQVATGLLVPQQFTTGDIDRDGDIDVVIAHTGQQFNPVGNEILWYEQVPLKGSGWVPHVVDASIPLPISVAVGDINNDGFMDIVGGSGSTGAGAIFWYANDGTPAVAASWAEAPVDSAFDGPSKIDLADMNGDGIIDVVAAGEEEDAITWWQNSTTQVFTPRPIDTLIEATRAVAVDFDGDGDMDVVGGSDNETTNPADDLVAWWENTDGTATTWTRRPIVDGTFNRLSGINAVDLDCDGDLDVVATAFAADTVSWFESETIHREFFFFPAVMVNGSSAFGVSMGDLDGDGDPDAAIGGVNGDSFAFLENDGSPSWSSTSIDTQIDGARKTAIADFDGDGSLDVAGVGAVANLLTFWSNSSGDGSVWTEDPVDTFLTGASALAVGDLDEDGNVDLVAGGAGGSINFYENRLDLAQGWTNHNAATGFTGLADLVVADFNHDGFLDFAGVSSTLNAVRWWESDGTPGGPGSFTERVIASDLVGAAAIVAGDFDKDGDTDIIAGGTGDVVYYENDGTGTSWTPESLTGAVAGATGMIIADLDRNGTLDLAYAEPIGTSVWTTEVEASGSTRSGLPDFDTPTGSRDLDFADIDGDGDADLLVVTSTGTQFMENIAGQFILNTAALDISDDTEGATIHAFEIEAGNLGLVGDSEIQLETFEIGFETTTGSPLTSIEANALVDRIFVTLDDGNSIPDGGDIEVASETAFTLDGNGRIAITLTANSDTQIVPDSVKSYFICVDLAADASAQIPGAFRLVHHTENSSTASDLSAGIPLAIVRSPNVESDLIAPGGNPNDINLDGNVNSVDIQLVINRVLGLSIAPFDARADVDASGSVNSVDIQLTINTVLGL